MNLTRALFALPTMFLLTVGLGQYESRAQTINDVPLSEINVDYVQIVGTSKLLSTKLTIQIDFGQRTTFWSQRETQLKDEKGKMVEFNSMIDALNFMTANGYEFVQAFTVSISNQNVYHYLLRRKKGQ